MIIEARDVEKSFGQTPALRGASVGVKRGEILAIMGPSGSGKSTLLHCLAGILTPDRGEVRFDGQRLDTLKEAERSGLRRDNFGFVFQFGQLVPELTAEENAALPLLLSATTPTSRPPPPSWSHCWPGTPWRHGRSHSCFSPTRRSLPPASPPRSWSEPACCAWRGSGHGASRG